MGTLRSDMGAYGGNGYSDFCVSTEDSHVPESKSIRLSNYPNPFNPSTTISFSFTTEITENTEIEIFNIKGQMIKSIPIPSSFHSPITSVTWNGTDNNNNTVSSGIYFYNLKSGDRVVASKKMLLLK